MAGLAGGGWLSSLIGGLSGKPPKVNPYDEAGVSGTAIFGGYVENIERDHKLYGPDRYRTAADILTNISIVGASIRYFLNLAAAPSWTVEPAEDMGEDKSSDAAKEAADFFQDVLDNCDTSWTRIVRRSGMFKFHGFGVQEWTARKREDGHIGLLDIESRPQHTIEKWIPNKDGTILGVQQRSPQTGELLWIPRNKYVYLVDDMLSDSPEGLGLFRHLIEPAERMKKYLKLEGQGYERDLRGIPIGRIPFDDINNAVKAGSITKTEGSAMVAAVRRFVSMQSKEADTGLLLDSSHYRSVTGDGTTISAAPKWAVELLTASGSGFKDIGAAIDRLTHDMALIMGTDSLLLGSKGAGGNRALGEDKSRNLYIAINGTVGDIAEAIERDVRDPLWVLNGFDEKIKPKIKTEDVAFKDVVAISQSLANMAMAGAVLQPDDPAIDDLRDLAGISRAPELSPAQLGAVQTQPGQPPGQSGRAPPARGRGVASGGRGPMGEPDLNGGS